MLKTLCIQNWKNHAAKSSLFAMLCATLFLAPVHPSFGETSQLDPELSERYQLKRDGNAFIRLDKKNGEMSICDRSGGKLICRMAADERAALQDEVALLQDRLDEMEARLDGKELAEVPKLKPKSKLEKNSDKYFDEELDKAVDYSAKVLRRFFTVMKELKDDFEN